MKKSVCRLGWGVIAWLAVTAGAAALYAQQAGPWQLPLRYEIWVDLDHGSRMLHGRETIEWTNTTADSVPDMALHLYWNAFKNERSAMLSEYTEAGVGMRQINHVDDGEWGWTDIRKLSLADGTDLLGGLHFEAPDGPRFKDDQTVARFSFPRPVAPGETVRLELQFEAKVPRVMRRAGYTHDSYFLGQWYPKPGVYEQGRGWNCHQYHQNSEFFADFADYTVHLTVPKGFVVGSSGRETDRRDDPARGTTTLTFLQPRVHDFAWAAGPRFVRYERVFDPTKEVSAGELADLARIFRCPPAELQLRPVRMILLLCREHAGQEEAHFRAVAAALKYYGLWYAPYPYDTITLIDPPYGSDVGGMEYPTLFTAGTALFPGKNTHTPEMVTVHEFGHGYWYGMSGSNEFEEAWLDEGINTYSTGKVMDKAFGPAVGALRYGGVPFDRYSEDLVYHDYDLDRLAGIQVVTMDPVTTWSWKFYSPVSYGLNVYQRAATLLGTLENLVGRETMMRIMRTFFQRYSFRHPHHSDFVATAEEVSGRPLGWFFSQLFEDTLVFDYAVSEVGSTPVESPRGVFERDGKRIEVTSRDAAKADQAQKNPLFETVVRLRRLGPAKLGGDAKLKLRVVFADRRERVVYWDGLAPWTEFRFLEPVKVERAELDPDGIFLVDANRSNNGLTVAAPRGTSVRWTGRIQFWLQSLFTLIGFFG